MKQVLIATCILLGISLSKPAQTTSPNHKLPEDLLHFFIRRSVKPIHRFRGLDVSDAAKFIHNGSKY